MLRTKTWCNQRKKQFFNLKTKWLKKVYEAGIVKITQFFIYLTYYIHNIL